MSENSLSRDESVSVLGVRERELVRLVAPGSGAEDEAVRDIRLDIYASMFFRGLN
jgi:hypothetical protein